MIKINTKLNYSLLFLCIAMGMTPFLAHAQLQLVENGRLGRELSQNLENYSQGYTQPVMDHFGANAASGMFLHQRDANKDWQWSVSLFISTTFLPEETRTMNFNELELESMELSDPSDPEIPTAVGFDSDQRMYYYPRDENGNRVSDPVSGQQVRAVFPVFIGARLRPNIVPAAGLQARLSYKDKTSFQARFLPVPPVRGVWTFSGGLGVMQHFGEKEDLFRWHLSYQLNYWNSRYGLELEDGQGGEIEGENQHAAFASSVHTIQAHASYKMGRVNVFAGAGMLMLANRFSIGGTYEFAFRAYGGPGNLISQDIQFSMEDPVRIRETAVLPAIEAGLSFDLGSYFLQMGYAYQRRSSVFITTGFFL